MFRVRNRISGASTPVKLYVSGSTDAVPLTIKSGMWLKPYANSNGELYWEKADTRVTNYKILNIDPQKKYGGDMAQTYYGDPFNSTGLAVPAYTAFDLDHTNEMLGMECGLDPIDGTECTVDTDGYLSTSSFTCGGLLFVSTTAGKLEQDDSPSEGDISVGYVVTVPANDHSMLTYRLQRKVIGA